MAEATDAIVFVADGRFHLEAIMIANPSIPAYRFSPSTSAHGWKLDRMPVYLNRGVPPTAQLGIVGIVAGASCS